VSPMRATKLCYLIVVAVTLLALPGCGEKKPTTNEKVTAANYERIIPDQTTLSEVEQLLGPGTDYLKPNLASGLKAKTWGRGKDGEEIEVVYKEENGLVVTMKLWVFQK
jgi:hypothetical protein